MADIELVIKIPEEIRLALINNIQLSLDQQSICDSYIKHAIINGTPTSEKGEKITIKAIEQEPCEDAVSRQEVLYLIADNDLSMGQVVRGIHALPPVTPQEPRKGHWISHREHCENLGAIPSGLGAYAWCSECDCAIDVGEWHRNRYNYCPNCGADMRESEIEE